MVTEGDCHSKKRLLFKRNTKFLKEWYDPNQLSSDIDNGLIFFFSIGAGDSALFSGTPKSQIWIKKYSKASCGASIINIDRIFLTVGSRRAWF
jgi:hypothetical protein